MCKTLFDLIAILFEIVIKYPTDNCKLTVSKEDSDVLVKKADDLLSGKINKKKICFGDKKCVNSQDFNDIIDTCKKENSFLFYRAVLCQLDLLINIYDLINVYDFNKFNDDFSKKIFESLNTNVKETGIVIIPKVPFPHNTFFVQKGNDFEDKGYKDSNYWYDNLNEHFNNIICIQEEVIKGYKINNVVIDFFKNQEKDKIVIGVTPCCNIGLDEMMKIHKYRDSETGIQSFEIEEYYNSEMLTKKFLKCLSVAKKNKVDILMGPEMLGSPELVNVDEYGFNSFFMDVNGEAPHLIVTPSLWDDGKNFLSVFLNSGELVGKQYKQNPFEFTDTGERFVENLKNIPREILLIHVPGWGRIAFPICVDYLVPSYRDMLARDLKVNLMLCPSYSTGTVQFGNASCAIRDFGTRFVWLNSCSALKKFTNTPESVGLVSVPITNPISLNSAATLICPKCGGNCIEGCLFIVTIQLRSKVDKHCNDVEINHVTL